jgi:hypothetical protein
MGAGEEYTALLAAAAPYLQPLGAGEEPAYGQVAVTGDAWLQARAQQYLRGLPELPLDDDDMVEALIVALAEVHLELSETALRAWDPGKHPRGPGGRFRSTVDVLKDAIRKHRDRGGDGDPFDGYDREQLRRVARARGIELERGEGRESIAAKLLDHLGGPAGGGKDGTGKKAGTPRLVQLRPETRAAVADAVKALPGSDDGWRDVVQQRRERMRITEYLGDARRAYRDAITNRDSSRNNLVALVGRRDPRVNSWETLQQHRPDLAQEWEDHDGAFHNQQVQKAKDRLNEVRDAYDAATDQIEALGGMKPNGDLPDGFQAPDGFFPGDFKTLVSWQGLDYQHDAAGTRLPPPALVQMHESVQRAGAAIHQDLQHAISNDAEVVRLRKERDRISGQRFAGTWSVASNNAINEQLGAVNHELKARERVLVKDALDQLRPIGGAKFSNIKPLTSKADIVSLPGKTSDLVPARADWQEHFAETAAHMPDDWVRRADGVELQLTSTERAYHQSFGRDWRTLQPGDSQMMAMDIDSGNGYVGAFTTYSHEVTFHETGHHMEDSIPGLKALEFAYVRSRTTHAGQVESTVRLVDVQGSSYEPSEIAYKDQFPDAYTGKTYENYSGDPANSSWEAFQVGLQQTFGRSEWKRYGDDSLEHFVLGVMATLGRY